MSINSRRRTVRGFLMASAAVMVLAGPALAQEARHSFNIPAGDAVTALQAFAKQSGKQVLFPFEAASGKQTPAVAGDIADVFFRAHRRNLELLQRELEEPWIEGQATRVPDDDLVVVT